MCPYYTANIAIALKYIMLFIVISTIAWQCVSASVRVVSFHYCAPNYVILHFTTNSWMKVEFRR